jgi:hypothetical protein
MVTGIARQGPSISRIIAADELRRRPGAGEVRAAGAQISTEKKDYDNARRIRVNRPGRRR